MEQGWLHVVVTQHDGIAFTLEDFDLRGGFGFAAQHHIRDDVREVGVELSVNGIGSKQVVWHLVSVPFVCQCVGSKVKLISSAVTLWVSAPTEM